MLFPWAEATQRKGASVVGTFAVVRERDGGLVAEWSVERGVKVPGAGTRTREVLERDGEER